MLEVSFLLLLLLLVIIIICSIILIIVSIIHHSAPHTPTRHRHGARSFPFCFAFVVVATKFCIILLFPVCSKFCSALEKLWGSKRHSKDKPKKLTALLKRGDKKQINLGLRACKQFYTSRKKKRHCFNVVHFAAPIEYYAEGWVAKNQDNTALQLVQALATSELR